MRPRVHYTGLSSRGKVRGLSNTSVKGVASEHRRPLTEFIIPKPCSSYKHRLYFDCAGGARFDSDATGRSVGNRCPPRLHKQEKTNDQ